MRDYSEVSETRQKLANSIYDLVRTYVATFGANGNDMVASMLDIDLVKPHMVITVDSEYTTECYSYDIPRRS